MVGKLGSTDGQSQKKKFENEKHTATSRRHLVMILRMATFTAKSLLAMQASAWATYRCQRLKAIYITIMPYASHLVQ